MLGCSPGLAFKLSKLSTAQTYPEYARALLESASVGFNAAVSEWEKRHGKVQPYGNNLELCSLQPPKSLCWCPALLGEQDVSTR